MGLRFPRYNMGNYQIFLILVQIPVRATPLKVHDFKKIQWANIKKYISAPGSVIMAGIVTAAIVTAASENILEFKSRINYPMQTSRSLIWFHPVRMQRYATVACKLTPVRKHRDSLTWMPRGSCLLPSRHMWFSHW